jgi:UDP-N-acetylglucosamine transferase subunit ALG13
VTLGSQKFQFNRLLMKIDDLIEKGIIIDKVFAQIGFSDYKPKNFEYKKFMDRNEFLKVITQCNLVITHGGTGSIINAAKNGKKVIAIPRLSKYGEHVDDHQIQILEQFDYNNIIEACYDIEHLEISYKKVQDKVYNKYISSTDSIINSIERFLENIGK